MNEERFNQVGQQKNTNILDKAAAGFKEFSLSNAEAIADRLANGQHPNVIGSSCIDSANPIEKKFGFEFGEAMGLRRIGGLYTPYDKNDPSSWYMEAEVSLPIQHQKVSDSFFTVHTRCAAAKAIALEEKLPRVSKWLDYVGKNIKRDAIARKNLPNDVDDATLIRAVEEQGAIHNYYALMTYPAIQEALEAGTFTLRSCLYDMEAGQIFQYNPRSDEFDLLFDSVPTPENDHCCKHGGQEHNHE